MTYALWAWMLRGSATIDTINSVRASSALAKLEEASSGVCCRETGQYWIQSQYALRLYGWAKKYSAGRN